MDKIITIRTINKKVDYETKRCTKMMMTEMIFARYYYYCDVDSMGKWREKKKYYYNVYGNYCQLREYNGQTGAERAHRSRRYIRLMQNNDRCGCHRRRNGIGTARCFRYNVKLLSKLSIACRTRMTLTCAIQCQLQFRFIKIINYWVKVHAEAYRCV